MQNQPTNDVALAALKAVADYLDASDGDDLRLRAAYLRGALRSDVADVARGLPRLLARDSARLADGETRG